MLVLELAFRIAACTQLLLLFLFFLSQSGRASAALFFLSIASYLLAPLVLRDWLWGAWAFPVLIMALLVPSFFCVFIGSMFLEGRLSLKRLLPLFALTAVVGFIAYSTAMGSLFFGDPRYWQWLAQLLKAAWGCMGLAIAFKDWQTDLVEPRRRLRMVILGGAGAYILGVLLVELLIVQQAQAWLELANVSLILVLVTLFCRHILALSPQNILTKIQGTPLVASPESKLAQDILQALENQRFYAGDNVTVKGLATAVDSQEYRVRRAINGEMGHRNFNAFINQYRVAEVAHRLQLPEFEGTPLLTLALDAGFRSLAPFNKAFKEHFSVTPSEYRTQYHSDT